MTRSEAFFISSLREHDGFKILMSELEAKRLDELNRILDLKNDDEILFAVAEARSSRNFLSLVDEIIDTATFDLDKIELEEGSSPEGI